MGNRNRGVYGKGDEGAVEHDFSGEENIPVGINYRQVDRADCCIRDLFHGIESDFAEYTN